MSLSFNAPSTTPTYPLSLHDALPICGAAVLDAAMRPALGDQLSERVPGRLAGGERIARELLLDERSEEHTSELQSRFDLVCRLLLEKKKVLGVRGTLGLDLAECLAVV